MESGSRVSGIPTAQDYDTVFEELVNGQGDWASRAAERLGRTRDDVVVIGDEVIAAEQMRQAIGDTRSTVQIADQARQTISRPQQVAVGARNRRGARGASNHVGEQAADQAMEYTIPPFTGFEGVVSEHAPTHRKFTDGGGWTVANDAVLLSLIFLQSPLNDIARATGHTEAQCRDRAAKVFRSGVLRRIDPNSDYGVIIVYLGDRVR